MQNNYQKMSHIEGKIRKKSRKPSINWVQDKESFVRFDAANVKKLFKVFTQYFDDGHIID